MSIRGFVEDGDCGVEKIGNVNKLDGGNPPIGCCSVRSCMHPRQSSIPHPSLRRVVLIAIYGVPILGRKLTLTRFDNLVTCKEHKLSSLLYGVFKTDPRGHDDEQRSFSSLLFPFLRQRNQW